MTAPGLRARLKLVVPPVEPTFERRLTVHQVAEVLGVTPDSVNRRARTGELTRRVDKQTGTYCYCAAQVEVLAPSPEAAMLARRMSGEWRKATRAARQRALWRLRQAFGPVFEAFYAEELQAEKEKAAPVTGGLQQSKINQEGPQT